MKQPKKKNPILPFPSVEKAAEAIGSRMVNPQGSVTESGSPFLWHDNWINNRYSVYPWKNKNGHVCGHGTAMIYELSKHVGKIIIAFPRYRLNGDAEQAITGAGEPYLVRVVSATKDEVALERI